MKSASAWQEWARDILARSERDGELDTGEVINLLQELAEEVEEPEWPRVVEISRVVVGDDLYPELKVGVLVTHQGSQDWAHFSEPPKWARAHVTVVTCPDDNLARDWGWAGEVYFGSPDKWSDEAVIRSDTVVLCNGATVDQVRESFARWGIPMKFTEVVNLDNFLSQERAKGGPMEFPCSRRWYSLAQIKRAIASLEASLSQEELKTTKVQLRAIQVSVLEAAKGAIALNKALKEE
jgi:hypothetical protein